MHHELRGHFYDENNYLPSLELAFLNHLTHLEVLVKKMSRQFRAVLQIIESSHELRTKALPHIDPQREEIAWSDIWHEDFGSGHLAALYFCYAIWRDDGTVLADPFQLAHSMDEGLRRSVNRAIGIWLGVEQ